MGRSQVKFRTTHGRGRGRGTESGARRAQGGRHGSRALESNAYRYEERVTADEDEDEDISSEHYGTCTQRQFFSEDKQYRQPTATKEAYFRSRTMQQWEEDGDDESTNVIGVIDFDWIATQLSTVPPSIRYQMDPKYCNDFAFVATELINSNEEESTRNLSNTVSPVVDELEVLLSHSATPVSTRLPASSVQPPPPTFTVIAEPSTAATSEQLEDWLDDVLDM